MNLVIDDELWNIVKSLINDMTALPVNDNGEVVSNQPDYLFANIYIHLDSSLKERHHPVVSVRFQSTYDNKYRYYLIDTNYKIYVTSEV